jgi:hypothetical protein
MDSESKQMPYSHHQRRLSKQFKELRRGNYTSIARGHVDQLQLL